MQPNQVSIAEPPPDRCLNCSELVPQNFCPNCGQEKSTRLVPADHLLHDALDEFLKLDSKLLTTLKPLLTRPGFLTNEYIAGRRVRYVSPFRLYFIVSALFFLVLSIVHYDITIMHDLAFGIEQLHPAHLAGDTAEGASDMPHMAHKSDSANNSDVGRAHRHIVAVNETAAWFIRNQSVITFLLVPIAALLLKLLYISSKRLYIEHLVFAVHVQTFMFLLLLPSLLPFARSVTYLAALTLSAAYLFLAMRNVYNQNVFATLTKCGVMLVSYMAVMAAICFCAFLAFYNF